MHKVAIKMPIIKGNIFKLSNPLAFAALIIKAETAKPNV